LGQFRKVASQTLHPSIEKPMLDGQAEPPPDRNPSCVAAEEQRATLGSGGAIRRGTTRLTDRRPQFAAREVGRQALKRNLSRAEPKVRIQLPPAASQANSEAVRKLLRNVADGSGEALGFAALPSHPTDAGKPVIYDKQFIAKPEEEDGGCAPSLSCGCGCSALFK
jgi:hypothetical protein